MAVERARRASHSSQTPVRKRIGGSMRQAGVLAAAGLLSLRVMVQRLHEDHNTARQLGDGLASLPEPDVVPPQTNINQNNGLTE